MKRILLLVYPLLSLVGFSSCRAQSTVLLPVAKDNNSLLWEISGNGLKQPSYIFGTFHIMCREDIVFSETLRKAVASSNEVYFEMDLDDPANTFGAILYMNMKGGKSLSDLYTEEEYKKLSAYFADSVKMPLTMFKRMKPMMLEALLYPKMLACKNMSGVEEELMKLAKEGKKEVKGFEDIKFQSSVFDSIPYDKQAKELLKTIDSIGEYKKYFDTMVQVYKSQRITEIETLFTKTEFGMEDNMDVLLYNRNRNWVVQLKNILPKKSIFAAVGAGHLVGDQGVLELLRKEGYTVKPLLNK
ncbi:MAG: TraB/GumN family protein [Ferruginibacter sp.]